MIDLDQAKLLIKQATRDLIKQGRYGYSADYSAGSGYCQYITAQGNSCLIGLLIKRKVPGFNLKDLSQGCDAHRALQVADKEGWTPEALALATAAQGLHDNCARNKLPLSMANLRKALNSYLRGSEVEYQLAALLDELMEEVQ